MYQFFFLLRNLSQGISPLNIFEKFQFFFVDVALLHNVGHVVSHLVQLLEDFGRVSPEVTQRRVRDGVRVTLEAKDEHSVIANGVRARFAERVEEGVDAVSGPEVERDLV
jgi:hypothetical protein